MMRSVLLFLLTTSAYASSGRTNYLSLLLIATVVATLISIYWVKKTPSFDNIHLRIIGFSVYFWIVVFAEVTLYGFYRYFVRT